MVTLQSFESTHLTLLATWLRQPHVAPWFPEPDADLAWAARPTGGGQQAVIASGREPVGYLRWQRVDRETLDSAGLHEIPANSVDADILLGDEAICHRGIGSTALRLLATELGEDPDVPLIGLTTSVENTRARRAFERAGFRIVRQYEPGVFGLCHLMTLDLRKAGTTHGGRPDQTRDHSRPQMLLGARDLPVCLDIWGDRTRSAAD